MIHYVVDSRMTIEKCPDGGYLVWTCPDERQGFARVPIFGSTGVDEALAYVKSKLESAPAS